MQRKKDPHTLRATNKTLQSGIYTFKNYTRISADHIIEHAQYFENTSYQSPVRV